MRQILFCFDANVWMGETAVKSERETSNKRGGVNCGCHLWGFLEVDLTFLTWNKLASSFGFQFNLSNDFLPSGTRNPDAFMVNKTLSFVLDDLSDK